MGTQNFFLKKTSFFISLPSSKLTISLISIIDLLFLLLTFYLTSKFTKYLVQNGLTAGRFLPPAYFFSHMHVLLYTVYTHTRSWTYLVIQSETMINSSRKNDQITFFNKDANPPVIIIPYVKVATAIHNKPYFLISMKMLFKKWLDLHKICNKQQFVSIQIPMIAFKQLAISYCFVVVLKLYKKGTVCSEPCGSSRGS